MSDHKSAPQTPTPQTDELRRMIERMIIENRDIDSDSINTIGQQDLAIDIFNLITSETNALLEQIESELPNKNEIASDMRYSEDYRQWHLRSFVKKVLDNCIM